MTCVDVSLSRCYRDAADVILEARGVPVGPRNVECIVKNLRTIPKYNNMLHTVYVNMQDQAQELCQVQIVCWLASFRKKQRLITGVESSEPLQFGS